MKIILTSQQKQQLEEIHESTVACYLSDYVLSEKLKPENGGSQCRLSEM